MAPIGHRAFPVNVLLSQSSAQDGGETIIVSKDISEEARLWNGQRYLALSTRESNDWKLYMTRTVSNATASSHSTVWLPGSIYQKFCDHRVYARPARPVQLSSVILSFPRATYHLVQHSSESLHAFAQTGHVFRTGETIEINGYRGEVTLCEPVRQGIVATTTEVVLARAPATGMIQNFHGSHADDQEDLEDDNAMQFSQLLENDTGANVSAYACQPLVRRIHHDELSPAVSSLDDDLYFAFAGVDLLIDLGCFSGDFVEVTVLDAANLRPRVVKLFSLPADYSHAQQNTIYVSPIFYHNSVDVSGAEPPQVRLGLRPVPRSPQYSIAKAVTLGRVPSPASNDRALQHAFFHALKLHFETSRRVVRLNDLILLGIDETLSRITASEEQDHGLISEFTQSVASIHADTFAWFKVTNVETDEEESFLGDVEVDSNSTRMVQSGTQKARIPPTSQWCPYYGLPQPMVFPDVAGTNYSKLHQLISSTFSKSARKSHACATILLHGARGSGKTSIVSGVASALGMHLLEVNCYDIIGETDMKTEAYLRLRFDSAGQCAPCVLLLRNIGALAQKKDDAEAGQESPMRFILADCLSSVAIDAGSTFPVAVVATTSNKDDIPEGVLGCFRHDLEIGAPDETERLTILQNLTKSLPLAPDVSVHSLAVRSAALVAADLVSVVKRAQSYSQDRMDNHAIELGADSVVDLHVAGAWVNGEDFDHAIGEARRNYSDSIGAPKIPNVTWEDVGGLASVKDDIMDTIQLPLERPELFASGMKKRSGILFYGPPGTGKTLLAKAVATSFSLNFFSVKGPELLNMYIGESEANVRRVFQRARDAKPCVVFFDELDSVAPKRGNQGDSGGVMDRIVSQLLSELDGMSEGKDGSGGGGVFVIGATNRPDLLDPALLRPGRFDKMLYLGVSDTDDAQHNILSALTRKFKLAPSLDLRSVAVACPFTYTGADFYALCSDAMLKAMTRRAGAVDAKVRALDPPRSTQYFFDHLATKADVEVVVSELDFMEAVQELVPSVSQSELDHYRKVQAQFSPVQKEAGPADKGKGKALANGVSTNGTNGMFHEDVGAGGDDDDDMYA
ncbi:Peroxisome assembly factor-2 [Taphrina deformans PYCC 5710]|uniref:Peroxisomal ATPase PEX6 n=1 Tax=Taphrina deformans (strain PYCC 5710 / ATCC 11124 / CBS 356.35 / IMI 108563 / JCM 9778 / NBRC 8474) TaxID=1097556 RepID=R4XII7_TAPDE|nr:Peroxisome assembly factor-2 [Taphrina deformans PYCC 5710]|eukprot:CCG83172.1 Peroxisome assembly factor-2 [Taphrina deformans PYCC 5710]